MGGNSVTETERGGRILAILGSLQGTQVTFRTDQTNKGEITSR